MNSTPQFPLLIVDSKGWLGWRPNADPIQFSLYGALNTHRWLGYDPAGQKWHVSSDCLPYPDRWWTRLLANTVYNPRFQVALRWTSSGEYSLQELQEQICALIDRDDDLLTQFHDAEELKTVARTAQSFEDLTAKLRKMKVVSE